MVKYINLVQYTNMMVDQKKFGKAASMSLGILIVFFANKLFEQAWAQQTYSGTILVMILIAMVVAITILIYINLPDK